MGDTDISAFSLVKSRRGTPIGVFDPSASEEEITNRTKNMRQGQRIELFTPAIFRNDGELYKFISVRCQQIAKRYEAHKV